MLKYKNKYQVRYDRDKDGKIFNRDSNFISCRAGGQIYRKDKDTLVFFSPKRIRLYKRDKETKVIIEDYRDLVLSVWDTDGEREIEFKEENLEKLKDILKIRKKRKVSPEFAEQARERIQKMWAAKKENQGKELSEEDLEELVDEDSDANSDNEDIDTDDEE